MAGRRKSDWDRTAPTKQSWGRFTVGQEVMVCRNTRGNRVSFYGTIERICIPLVGWKFVVVRDAGGGSHACDFEELS
jgi:hypothetical protein